MLVVCLFVSATFAEGDMGTGGKTCTGNCLVSTGSDGNEPKKDESTVGGFVRSYLKFFFEYLEVTK
jgi:hypothetical protein